LVHAADPLALQFVQRYAAVHSEQIELRTVSLDGSGYFFEPPAEDERPKYQVLERAIQRVLPDVRCVARASRFLPEALPTVLTESPESRRRRIAEHLAHDPAVPSSIRSGLLELAGAMQPEPLTLHLNIHSPIIRRLAESTSTDDELSHRVFTALYHNALLLLWPALSEDGSVLVAQEYNRLLKVVLEAGTPPVTS
jgi:hypothetical protein